MNLKKSTFLILSFIVLSLSAGEYKFNASQLQNPRNNNGWVTQVGNYLTNQEITAINHEIDKIEKETTVEIAVVIIPNTGGDIFNAAQEIFNLWKIGKADTDNGILILSAMEERQIRTHTGTGMQKIFTDNKVKHMQNEILVPHYKKGEYGQGILEYIKDINYVVISNGEKSDFDDSSNTTDEKNQENMTNTIDERKQDNTILGKIKSSLIMLIIGLALLILGLTIILLSIRKTKNNMNKSYDRYSKIIELIDKGMVHKSIIAGLILTIIGGFIFTFIFIRDNIFPNIFNHLISAAPCAGVILSFYTIISGKIMKNKIVNKWRNDPRSCPECSNPMRKQDEKEDNKFLKHTQVVEEEIKTMDYDVWLCTHCDNKTIEAYKAWKYYLYIPCPKCNSIAYKKFETKITSYPTYTSTGTKRITFACTACGHKNHKYITLPKKVKTESTYSSSSFGSSSSSSSSSSFGSSSSFSSSSSSFGGGSSSGGGSTSSW